MTSINYPRFQPAVLALFLIVLFSQNLNAQITNQTLTPASSSICAGDSTTIATGSSQSGVRYYLRNNADSSIVDGPLIGNGSALTFSTGALNSSTSYHVFAEQPSGCMEFDGIDDYLVTDSLVPYDNSSTLMAWYKSSDFSSGAVFTWGSPVVNNYAVLEFRYVNPSFNYIRFYKPQTTFPSVLPHPSNPTDWHHVAIVQNGATTQLYLDGSLAATGYVPSPTNPTMTCIGAGLFNGSIQLHYDGLIDEVSYWDTVLSPAQIQQYMNSPLIGNEANLALYYPLDAVNGNSVPDLSPGGNDAQMMNMPANPIVAGVFPGGSAFMNQIISITVDTLPVVFAGTNQTICAGDSVTLSGSGASTYTWDNNVTDGVPFVPTATTTYTVVGANGNCTDADTVTVTVNPRPNVSAGTSQTICAGDSVTLTGAGANSYSWDNNVTDGVPFVPGATATYTVTGTDGNGCTGTDQVTVTVNPLPQVSAGSDRSICTGDSVTLTGAGANGYTWDNNVTDGVPFAPGATTTYTVTGTGGNGCTGTDQVTVTVNPLPQVSAGSDQDICDGSSVTLAGSGAASYSWNNNVMDGVPFTPQATASYIITGTDTNGCMAMDTVDVSVIVVDATVSVSGNTLTANAVGAAYQWLDCNSGFTPIPGETNAGFTPAATGDYAVAVTEMGCTDTSGCENVLIVGIDPADQVEVLIAPNPNNGRFSLTLRGLGAGQATVEIVDIRGKIMHQATLRDASQQEFDLWGAAAGIYFLKVHIGDIASVRKVVIR